MKNHHPEMLALLAAFFSLAPVTDGATAQASKKPRILTAAQRCATSMATRLMVELDGYSEYAPATIATIAQSVGVTGVVRIDITNGPGTDTPIQLNYYLPEIQILQAAGICVIGDVDIYAALSIDDAKTQIDEWQQWYAVDGIWLDDGLKTATPANEVYLSTLATYARGTDGLSLIVQNAGWTDQALVSPTYADITVEQEKTYSAILSPRRAAT